MASGDLIYQEVFSLTSLTTPQRTALVAFINTLGWPGAAADLIEVTARRSGPATSISASLTGTRQVAPSALPDGVFVQARVP